MAIPSRAREVLIAEVRESFGRVAYTHKTHEKEADAWKTTDDRVRLLQVVLSVLTTGGLLAIIVTDEFWLKVASAVVSAGMFVITAYTKNFRAGEVAKEHQAVAHRLWLIREQYLSLLSDLEGEAGSLDDARARRSELQERLAAVYEGAPRTSSSSYAAAQMALQVKDELTFTDAEIDKFLPSRLRKAGGGPPSPPPPPAS